MADWILSIQFKDGKDTIISSITYNSLMNCVSNLPNWGLYYLQLTNTKTKITKTLPIEPNNSNDSVNDIDEISIQEI